MIRLPPPALPSRVFLFRRPLLSFALTLAVTLGALGCGGGYEYRVARNAGKAEPGAPAAAPSPSPQPDRAGDGFPDRADVAPDEGEEGGRKLAQLAQRKPAGTATDAHDISFLIYTAELTMAVFQVSKGMDAVEQIGRDVGGYLSARADSRVVIRVPRERFDDTIHRVEKDKIAYSTITVDFQPLHAETVENHASLPFPWLQELGLSSLLSVHQ